MINKKLYLTRLFDFYGNLLTANQREIMDMYCNYDWSLGEISDKKEISRQAVYDTVKRSEEKLEDFEKKLKLLNRFEKLRNNISSFKNLIEDIDQKTENEKIKEDIKQLKIALSEIVENY